jgi:hypothetical protein
MLAGRSLRVTGRGPHQGTRFPSRKKPPVGPPRGSIAAHTIPSAPLAHAPRGAGAPHARAHPARADRVHVHVARPQLLGVEASPRVERELGDAIRGARPALGRLALEADVLGELSQRRLDLGVRRRRLEARAHALVEAVERAHGARDHDDAAADTEPILERPHDRRRAGVVHGQRLLHDRAVEAIERDAGVRDEGVDALGPERLGERAHAVGARDVERQRSDVATTGTRARGLHLTCGEIARREHDAVAALPESIHHAEAQASIATSHDHPLVAWGPSMTPKPRRARVFDASNSGRIRSVLRRATGPRVLPVIASSAVRAARWPWFRRRGCCACRAPRSRGSERRAYAR